MKKYLLPSAIILALGLGLAVAQNITKSVQLSQFPTGPIGMDSSNNIFFPAHVLNNGKIPTVSNPVGTAATILSTSTDWIGQITGGAATTGATTVTFNSAYGTPPTCIVAQSGGTASTLAYTAVATSLQITSIVGTGIFNYLCSGTQ